MSQASLSGDDVAVIAGRNITDFADQNYAELNFPNSIVTVKTGKNGNTLFAQNVQGNNADFVMRLIRASADDIFFNGLLSAQNSQSFPATVVMNGSFIKQVGDGAGNIAYDTYVVSGGVFEKIPEVKANADGDTEQSVSIYRIKFAYAVRVIT